MNAAARLDVLNRVYGSDAAVAKLLNIDPSQPRRGREGQLPDSANASRLNIFTIDIKVLSTILSPTSIPKPREGPNAHLDDRTPMYRLKTHHVAEVYEAMDAFRTGGKRECSLCAQRHNTAAQARGAFRPRLPVPWFISASSGARAVD